MILQRTKNRVKFSSVFYLITILETRKLILNVTNRIPGSHVVSPLDVRIQVRLKLTVSCSEFDAPMKTTQLPQKGERRGREGGYMGVKKCPILFFLRLNYLSHNLRSTEFDACHTKKNAQCLCEHKIDSRLG